ncbi:uncharacterized protein WCC33_009369 [Rhinophrynus dorsalis]
MAAPVVLVLCLSYLAAVSASHMQGGIMTFRPREKNPNGSYRVDFKYKAAFTMQNHREFYWPCSSGNCGSEVQHSYLPVDNNTNFQRWFQSEGYMVRHLTSDKPFYLMESSCCWVINSNNQGSWSLQTGVDLGTRSDTSKPNNSPVTTIIPVIRVPSNCPSSFKLLAHDPDGDTVRCRYGNLYSGECATCYRPPQFTLDQNSCILSFSSSLPMYTYVFELVLEDFPNQNIYLTYNDGTTDYRYRPMARKRRESAARYYWTESYTTDGYTVGETSMVTDTSPHATEEPGTTATETPETDTTDCTTDGTMVSESFSTPSSGSVTEHSTVITDHHTYPPHSTSEEPSTAAHSTVHFTNPSTEVSPSDTEPIETSTAAHSTVDLTDHTTEVSPSDTEPIETSAVTETSTAGYPYWTTAWEASPSYAPPIHTLSKIPLQFLLEVTSAAPTCTYGEYRPKFLPPTPNQGETVMTRAGSPLQIHLTAQATYNSITDFKVSGPSQLSKVFTSSSGSSTRSMLVQWTPSENDVGDHVPFCFVAETVNGYQSELRCIIAVVGPSKLANVTLICNENTMTLFIAKSPGDDNGWLLDDPRCLVTSNSTHHIASVAYNSCGTKTEETEDYIVFKNRVTSFHNTTDVITRKHQLAIPFNCSFPKKNRLSNAFRPQKAVYEFTEAGFGNFTYKFQFYTDKQFIDIQTQYPLEVWLRDELYMEVQVTSTVPNVQLFVESCRATPHDDPNYPVFYDIILDGCLKDETVVVYPGTRTRARFGMEAFAFIGNYEEVYLSCTVILCKLGEPNTRCTRGCINSSLLNANQLRSRRSLTSESQRHFISQGPLRMKKRSLGTGSNKNQSLNVNTLVVSLSGVAIVALIALIMHIYIKKSRTANYEKLPTQAF